MGRRVLRRVLRRGSKKGLSRRHLEGRNTPFREYDPVGVRPNHDANWERRRVLFSKFSSRGFCGSCSELFATGPVQFTMQIL